VKLWCYDDAHDYGQAMFDIAKARGHDVHLFNLETARSPDFGFVFMHMHHHPSVRVIHKRIMSTLAMNPELVLIPNYRSSVLFDDKIEQARQFAKWMPKTSVHFVPETARASLEGRVYPFISKGSEGAAANNVRLVMRQSEANAEIRMAFSDVGIKSRFGQTQRGYLLWQDYIPNEGDIRIVAIGSRRLVLRRANRADQPITNVASSLRPVNRLDDETHRALTYANRFLHTEAFDWGCVDLIANGGNWHVLEMAVSWTSHWFSECRFFDVNCQPTEEKGDKIFEVLLDEIEKGSFR
jgi:glutathione synthase/RimK-type ligase-like ATP-grasp enzyme